MQKQVSNTETNQSTAEPFLLYIFSTVLEGKVSSTMHGRLLEGKVSTKFSTLAEGEVIENARIPYRDR